MFIYNKYNMYKEMIYKNVFSTFSLLFILL